MAGGEGQGDTTAGRPADDAGATNLEAVEHRRDVVGGSGDGRPGVPAHEVRAAVARAVHREQRHLARARLLGVGVEDPGARGAVAEDDRPLVVAVDDAGAREPARARRRPVNRDPTFARDEHVLDGAQCHASDPRPRSRHLLS